MCEMQIAVLAGCDYMKVPNISFVSAVSVFATYQGCVDKVISYIPFARLSYYVCCCLGHLLCFCVYASLGTSPRSWMCCNGALLRQKVYCTAYLIEIAIVCYFDCRTPRIKRNVSTCVHIVCPSARIGHMLVFRTNNTQLSTSGSAYPFRY